MAPDNSPEPWTCADCGEDQDATETRHLVKRDEQEVFWTGGDPCFGPICEACKVTRENREPADDGDAWAGGFARNH